MAAGAGAGPQGPAHASSPHVLPHFLPRPPYPVPVPPQPTWGCRICCKAGSRGAQKGPC